MERARGDADLYFLIRSQTITLCQIFSIFHAGESTSFMWTRPSVDLFHIERWTENNASSMLKYLFILFQGEVLSERSKESAVEFFCNKSHSAEICTPVVAKGVYPY